jgi:type IV pilus assembly protein PilW
MDMMGREIRMAGYDPSGTGFDGIPYDATKLQIHADLNGDGNTSTGADEIIAYAYDNANLKINRTVGTAGTPELFAENIQSFTFNYLDGGGAPTTTTSDIRQVRITITARTDKPDPDYPGVYRTYTLTSVITPQNIAL